jgi:hypothetical protein
LRALFTQLEQWAVDGVTPPPSAVPRQADGTAASRETVLESIRERFPAAAVPDASVLPYTPDIDPGVVEWPPTPAGTRGGRPTAFLMCSTT